MLSLPKAHKQTEVEMPYAIVCYKCPFCGAVYTDERLANHCASQGNPGQKFTDRYITINGYEIEILESLIQNVFGYHVRFYRIKTALEIRVIPEALILELLSKEN